MNADIHAARQMLKCQERALKAYSIPVNLIPCEEEQQEVCNFPVIAFVIDLFFWWRKTSTRLIQLGKLRKLRSCHDLTGISDMLFHHDEAQKLKNRFETLDPTGECFHSGIFLLLK